MAFHTFQGEKLGHSQITKVLFTMHPLKKNYSILKFTKRLRSLNIELGLDFLNPRDC